MLDVSEHDGRHTHYMEMALQQAKLALSSGEVPVGCVFVYQNEIIARGANQTNATCNATRHAELVAIDSIVAKYSNPIVRSDVLSACRLYVTVEPCIMCASALAQLGIQWISFGCCNERFGGCGSVLNVWNNNPSLVQHSGLLKDEAIQLLQQFYAQTNQNAPEAKRKAKRKR